MRLTDTDILNRKIEQEEQVDDAGNIYYSNNLNWDLDGTTVEDLKK